MAMEYKDGPMERGIRVNGKKEKQEGSANSISPTGIYMKDIFKMINCMVKVLSYTLMEQDIVVLGFKINSMAKEYTSGLTGIVMMEISRLGKNQVSGNLYGRTKAITRDIGSKI